MKSMNAWVRAVVSTAVATTALLVPPSGFTADNNGVPSPASGIAAPAPTPDPVPPAQPTAPGNAARGRAASNTCLGCHGVDGYRNAYPNYSVPKLSGQHPDYIVSALKA